MQYKVTESEKSQKIPAYSQTGRDREK